MSTKKQLSIRIVSFLLTMLMVITAAPVTVISAESSGTADAQLILDNVFAMPGETVEMNITLKNAPTVKSMSISNITFDTDKMTLTNVEWICDAEIKNWNQSQGRGVLAFSENTDANGTVVKLTFEINKIVDDADVNVMCAMSLKRMDDADNEIPVPVSIISGSVTIRNAIRGDMDANDKLNSNDAVYLLYYVMFGKDDYPIRQNGDMDGNGKVNSNDALSDIVTTTKGYGNSYSKGGSDTKTQGFSSTASNTTGTSSSVTYSKLESKTTTSTYSVDGRIEGKYRSILVGKAHVFAVVGYDYAAKSYFTYTFSVMDDNVKEFLDYTPKGGSFDDCEYSCLPFEIPYDVFEYVSGRTFKTTGVQYITDSLNGTAKVTGYVGESKDVIIPSYVSDGKQAYKVTEISGKAFAGKSVRSVSLGEFITEIPDGAFKNCTMLEEVVGSFTSIGNEAFSGCVNLTNMNIPSNVVKIGTDAFVGANSISVRAVNSLASYTEAVQQLPDASDEEIRAKQKEITQEFIKAILDSGAQNIVLDISYIAEGTPLSLTVPKIESIEINGGTKTYNDFRIDSSAENTTLNELTVVDSRGTPIKVDSGKLTLRKVFVNSNTTAVILKRDGAILSLSQDSAVKTNSSYAIIGKNLVIESQVTADGASGYLGVTGNLGYVNSVSGEDYISISNGDLIQISEEEFERYIKGQSTVSFDANEGILDASEASCSVFYGEKIGTLPVPARDYHNFLGWFTEKDGGTRITEDDVVTRTDDITLYAHWELKPLSGWVRADSVPADGAAVNRYWSFTVSSTSGVDAVKRSEWQLVSSSSQWSDYGAWSSWSRNSISSSDSRQVQTKTVTDREAYTNYRYWIYRSSDGYSFGTKNYKSDSGRICTKYDEINLTYPLESLGYSGLYGYYDSSVFSHSYDNKWFFGESTDVPAETHTEYSYRDRSLVYTYSFESTYDPTVYENVSNAVEWVQYRVK